MAHGQFEPGNKIGRGGARRGAGRKPDEWKRLVNRALTDAISEDDVKDMFETVAKFARAGNVKAAQFIIERMAGKAVQPVENTGKDGGPQVHAVALLTDEERKKLVGHLLQPEETPGD